MSGYPICAKECLFLDVLYFGYRGKELGAVSSSEAGDVPVPPGNDNLLRFEVLRVPSEMFEPGGDPPWRGHPAGGYPPFRIKKRNSGTTQANDAGKSVKKRQVL